jgi:hypothetical protein
MEILRAVPRRLRRVGPHGRTQRMEPRMVMAALQRSGKDV